MPLIYFATKFLIYDTTIFLIYDTAKLQALLITISFQDQERWNHCKSIFQITIGIFFSFQVDFYYDEFSLFFSLCYRFIIFALLEAWSWIAFQSWRSTFNINRILVKCQKCLDFVIFLAKKYAWREKFLLVGV